MNQNIMGSSKKSKRRALPANYVYKTAGDFMRWRKLQEVLKKQAAKNQRNLLKQPALLRKP